jgi:hypothetical protein
MITALVTLEGEGRIAPTEGKTIAENGVDVALD